MLVDIDSSSANLATSGVRFLVQPSHLPEKDVVSPAGREFASAWRRWRVGMRRMGEPAHSLSVRRNHGVKDIGASKNGPGGKVVPRFVQGDHALANLGRV